jgi:hypothetical protein
VLTVRACVRNGRLVVDEPTDLPEGTEVELVADDVPVPDAVVDARLDAALPADEPLSTDEAEDLRRIRASIAFSSHEEVGAKLRARR